MTAELKGRYFWKKDVAVASAPNGDKVVELRRDPGGTILQTKSQSWRCVSGEDGPGVIDQSGASVAHLRRRRLRGYDVQLAGGEVIEMREHKLGYGCTFGQLAVAKAPFIAPQRHFTLSVSDALLAREDRELLLALFTYLAETSLSTEIMVRAN